MPVFTGIYDAPSLSSINNYKNRQEMNLLKMLGRHLKELAQGMTVLGFSWCFVIVYLLIIGIISMFLAMFPVFCELKNNEITSYVKYSAVFISVESSILCAYAVESSWKKNIIFCISTIWIIATTVALILHFFRPSDGFLGRLNLDALLPICTISFVVYAIGPLFGIHHVKADKDKDKEKDDVADMEG